MFLGFDIGNTSTLMGLYNENSPVPKVTFRYKTIKKVSYKKLSKIILNFIKDYDKIIIADNLISDISFSTVVPEVVPSYIKMANSLFNINAYEINHLSKLKIKLNYKNPAELGPDRIVNAEAAFIDYGGNIIIIDIGTAATFCVILEDGTFDGGLIAPGIGTTINALYTSTSRLPKIEFELPDNLVAKDTENAIKSGFFYGWISMIEGILRKIEKQYNIKFKVILTGGYSEKIIHDLDIEQIFDPDLTMKGIKYIYDINKM